MKISSARKVNQDVSGATRPFGAWRPQLAKPLRLLLATMLVAVAAGMAQTALAQDMGPMAGGPGGLHGGAMMMGRALDKVNATPAQRSQIQAIMDAARADLKAQHAAGASLRQQLQSAMAQPTINSATVEGLRVQIQAQQDGASKRMTQAMLDAANVLTPEQRATLSSLSARRQSLMQRQAAERAALDKPNP